MDQDNATMEAFSVIRDEMVQLVNPHPALSRKRARGIRNGSPIEALGDDR